MPEIVHWNPPVGPVARVPFVRHMPWVPRRMNFGDLLGPWIVERMRQRLGLGEEIARAPRLLAVGSIMRLAQDNDVIWGTGVNGKSAGKGDFPHLDVRAVRGPRTAEVLRQSGISTPSVFGDPALLIPHLWSDEELGIERGSGGVVYMPNLHDTQAFPKSSVSPIGPHVEKVRILASAERVVASSLHAIIIAEAYQVPAILVQGKEPSFKYHDYFEGTGRSLPRMARDWRAADEIDPTPPLTEFDHAALIDAFPRDLWRPQ